MLLLQLATTHDVMRNLSMQRPNQPLSIRPAAIDAFILMHLNILPSVKLYSCSKAIGKVVGQNY